MKAILRIWLLLLALVPLGAWAQAPGGEIPCDGKLYQIRQVGTTTRLFRVDRTTSPYTTVQLQDLGLNLNALAYNQQDNYLYALTYADGTSVRLYKIGTGGAQDLGLVRLGLTGTANIPAVRYAGGAIDQNGIFYFSTEAGSSSLYRIDLKNITALTPTPRATTVSLGASYTFYDLAISPLDNEIYGTFQEGDLFRIVPNTAGTSATVADISDPNPPTTNDPVGTAFFDAAGTLLVASNGATGSTTDPGNFYLVNINANQTASDFVLITTLPRSTQSDGASCIYPSEKLDVVKSVGAITQVSTTEFTVPYTIKVKNTATELGVNVANIQVSDFLFRSATGDNATNITFGTANLPTAGTNPSQIQNLAISDDDPSVTYTLNNTFNGTTTTTTTGGVTTTRAGLLAQGQTLNQGRTITITFTVRVRYTGGSPVPSTAQLNTAIASGSSVANPGYRLDPTSGSYIPPIDLLAADQSTNGTTLPLLPNGDTPSPTPVNFTASIAGTVFEDVNYGGGAGRSQAASSGVGVSGARVELYSASGGTFIASTTTDADGFYSFGGLTNGTNYTVRVVNTSVKSTRDGGSTATTTFPVQTYANASKVGGNFPAGVDPGNRTTGGLPTGSQSTLVLAAAVGTPTQANFGFNFSTIVNTNPSGQGSLSQFITNSNTLLNDNTDLSTGNDLYQEGLTPGVETSIFMIPVATIGAVATINQTSSLPPITDKNTAIDGTTQVDNNTAQLGAGGTVGTGGAAATLSKVDRPNIEIVGDANTGDYGLQLNAINTTVKGIIIRGFGNSTTGATDANILIGTNATSGTLITGNIIGASATFTSPAATVGGNGILLLNATTTTAYTGTISNNIIAYNRTDGIDLQSSATAFVITDNEIRGNGRIAGGTSNGINVGINGAVISNNLIAANQGAGIDLDNAATTGTAAISGNTVQGNGTGATQNPGIRVNGTGVAITENVITANAGSGVLVRPTATLAKISENSIYSNTGIGIDLQIAGAANTNQGASVTLNDSGDGDGGANGLINFPVIEKATLSGTSLEVTGFAKAGATIEFFVSDGDGTNFGEGQSYLFTAKEGTADGDATTGTYGTTATGTTVNGINQGTETLQNRFKFTVTLTAAQAAALTTSSELTATAFLTGAGNGTSEFSGVVDVNLAPVAANVTSSPAIPRGSTQAVLSALSATDTDGLIATYQISTLPTSGTLFYAPNADGTGTPTAVLAANLYGGTSPLNLTAQQAATLRFTPAAGATLTNVTFTYTATDNQGAVDLTPATFTIQLSNVLPETADKSVTMSSGANATAIPVLTGTDTDGTVDNFELTNLSAVRGAGTLSYISTGTTRTTIGVNTITLTTAQAATLQYDPIGTSNGTLTFNVAAIDNNSGKDATPATYTIILSNVAPVANNVTHSPAIASTSTARTNLVDFSATDPDGLTTDLTYQIRSLPSSGTLYYTLNGTVTPITAANLQGGSAQLNLTTAQANSVSFTPSLPFSGNATFTYGVTDLQGLTSNTATYTVPVTNQAPTVAATSTTMPSSNGSTAIPVPTANDADGTIAKYTLSNLPAFTLGTLYVGTTPVTAANFSNLELTLAQAQNLRFDPTGTSSGSYVFNFTATDNNGLVSATTAAYTINVSNVAPETASKSASMSSAAASTAIPALTGSDDDGTVENFSLTNIANIGTRGTLSYLLNGTRTPISANITLTSAQAATLEFDPSGTYTGVVTFSVAAIDNNNATDASPATYTITLGNVAPVASNGSSTMLSSAPITNLNDLIATDADNGTAGVTTATFTLSNLPTAAGTLYVRENGTDVVVNTANFPNLQITANQALNLRFDPNGSVNGPVAFNFTVTDVQGGVSNTATYTINLGNVAPTVTATGIPAASAIPSTNGPTLIPTLIGSDADGTISFLLTSLPAHGTLSYNTGANGTSGTYVNFTSANLQGGSNPVSLTPAQAATLQYDPAGNFPVANNTTDVDPFNYTAIDNNGALAATPVVYNVRVRENDTEAVYSSPNIFAQGGLTDGSVVATVTDADGAITSATLAAGSSLPAFLTLNPTTGTITVNNNAVTPGTYTASVNTVDAKGGESTVSVSITLTNTAPVAQNVTNSPDMVNTAAATAILPLVATDADGTISSYKLSGLPNNNQGVLYVGTTELTNANFSGLVLTPAQAANLYFDPAAGFVGTATFSYTATDNNGSVSNTATYSIPVEAPNTLNGIVFEDVNYGGGEGRSLLASGGAVRSGATVELYRADGTFVQSTTTNSTGAYNFSNLLPGSYQVRVVNSTVTSSRQGGNTAGLLAVQTFVNGDGTKVGGTTPAAADALPNTGSQTLTQVGVVQSLAAVTVSAGQVLNSVDFGFNFDVVVNTNDAGQGSLRQFILNSNALVNNNTNGATNDDLNQEGQMPGIEAAIFRIPAAALSATGTFVINLTSDLPNVGARTKIGGSLQTAYTGDTNAAVAGVTTGPEVILNVTNINAAGLVIGGADVTIEGLGITGARGTAANLTNASSVNGSGIYVLATGDRASISNTTLYGNLKGGILVNEALNVSITNNVVLNNGGTLSGVTNINGVGIELLGATQALLTGNTVSGNTGYGIQLVSSATGNTQPANNTISLNTVSGNGTGTATTQRAGLAILTAGAGNLVSLNTFSGNVGDGILATAGTTNTFSQNQFAGNGEQSIDLADGVANTGVSINDDQDGDTGANNLANFPVFKQATIDNGILKIEGYASAGATVELYLANPGSGENFGEGGSYVFSFVEGSNDDKDTRQASYSGQVNGLDQGAETNQNMFQFSLDLSTLPEALRNALTALEAKITATATTVADGTSEFSGNLMLTAGPLPVELTVFTAKAVAQDAQLAWHTASEKNNAYFTVERSFDGRTFSAIGQKAGNGSTTTAHDYAFTDKGVGRLHSGLVYYRLRQVDLDGTFSLSETRTVRFSAPVVAGTVQLYPNPATTQSTLDLSNLPQGSYQVTLVDMAGRIVRTVSVQGGLESKLEVRDLAEGTYTVLVRGQNTTHNLKLVKRN
ncbi:right-handed parallel beta-helix repeat-containing protein [Hymenobacter sp. J193]|uniref:right-handed parallel beta-helix repeat-containing protein n=1 Tax=Hymenobacter sp. J193 TaxID=2898429 RepID=UPI002150BC6D|nr:right-handed parallel beta-helix repeat-containing protein [Hymenobacter sp. J193]MCR5888167.1 right-handed parallel beta-helix repeat-containing protein [Hymenobacter sp. J193]